MRPNVHLWLREDAQRFCKQGFRPSGVLERKAGFDPDQPRDEQGRWTDTDASDAGANDTIELPPITVTADRDSASEGEFGEQLLGDEDGGTDRQRLFHLISDANPNNGPPKIPSRRPPSRSEVNAFLKAAARWIAKAGNDPRVKAFILLYEAMSWLDIDRYYIDAYRDPPKILEELRAGARQSKWGYDTHHIVEQTPAENEDYPRSLIDGQENLVRIPALKHWEITGWYATKNDRFGGMSPRDYLRDKGWEEKTRVGLDALRTFGVLKP